MRVSDAEWRVLQILWEHPDISASDLAHLVQQIAPWKPTTIKTLLGRLVKKKAVGFRPEIGGYRYFPMVTRAVCEAEERRTFLQKVYGGDVKPMLTAFLSDEKLTAEDIAELKRLLDQER